MKPTGIRPEKIDCFPSPSGPPTEKGCASVLDVLPFDSMPQTFGPHDDTHAAVWLPRSWEEDRSPPQSRCQISLNTNDGAVIKFSWSKLWLLGAVVNAVCVRQGKGGAYAWNGMSPPCVERRGLSILRLVGTKTGYIGLLGQSEPNVDTA